MAEREKFPIGIEDFEEIRTMEYYYVDKTGRISTLLKIREKSIVLLVRGVVGDTIDKAKKITVHYR